MTTNMPGSFDRDDPRFAAELAALDAFGVEAEVLDDDRVRVTPSGDLDMLTAPQLQHEVDEFLAKDVSVVLDLSRLDFLDSAGMRALLLAHGTGRVELCDPSPAVVQVFEVAKLTSLLPGDSPRR